MTGIFQLLTYRPQTPEELMAKYQHPWKRAEDTLRLLVAQGKVNCTDGAYSLTVWRNMARKIRSAWR